MVDNRPIRELFARTQNWTDIWRVLSALRGPDERDAELKRASTAVLRYHVLGEEICVALCVECGPDAASLAALRRTYRPLGGHFIGHTIQAFDACGLRWDEVNL